MSVYALKPKFGDYTSYMKWMKMWNKAYQHISNDIRRRKLLLKEQQRAGGDTKKIQRDLLLQRADGRKMMTLVKDAKALWDRIKAMKQQMAEQQAQLPITFTASRADFHFNKGHIQFPTILPRWMLKANGKTYYVDHMDAQMGFSTRELDEGSTLGMLRFRNCSITIDENGTATMREKVKVLEAA